MNTKLPVSTILGATDLNRRTSRPGEISADSRPRLRSQARGMLALLALNLALTLPAPADTTAFTWQGRLTDSGQPANGLYDLTFVLYDAASGGQRETPASAPPAPASALPWRSSG